MKTPPTYADVKAVILAWLADEHPDEKDVQLIFWDSLQCATSTYNILGVGDDDDEPDVDDTDLLDLAEDFADAPVIKFAN